MNYVFLLCGFERHEVVCSILLFFDALFSNVVQNPQRQRVSRKSLSPLPTSGTSRAGGQFPDFGTSVGFLFCP